MIALARIIEYQAALSSYRATRNAERAEQLEFLIELTKPINHFADAGWHPLIFTPFRYSPPHPNARFRAPYGKNVFYASLFEETAMYEHAFHFMKERIHLKEDPEAGIRTLFFIDAYAKNAVDIKDNQDYLAIIDKNNYIPSQQYVTLNPRVTFIWYPSCRDPLQRNNAAVLDIKQLGKNPLSEFSIKFFYDYVKQQITWLDYAISISWKTVA